MSKRSQLILALLILLIIAVAVLTFQGVAGIGPWVNKLNLGLDIEGGVAIVFEGEQKNLDSAEFAQMLEQTKNVLARRIDSFGLTEPNITKQGENRIRIELPGAKDVDEALAQVGKTAVLGFYQVNENQMVSDNTPFDEKTFPGKLLFKGDKLETSGVAVEDGSPVVTLRLSDEANKIFADASKDIVDHYAQKSGQIAIVLDDTIISAPLVSSHLDTKDLIIKGKFTSDQAIMLSSLIRGGALPIELKEVQTTFINATLGRKALDQSIKAGIFGFIAIVLIMLIRYRFAGLLANIALVLYAAMLFIVMIFFNATLTLPGIAGLVLSVGMAVDANVIIFERLREDLKLGKSLGASIRTSFKKAMTTIMDSNITTLLASVILYNFGEGPIKGFAITLMIGILLSMFTAVVLTRYLLTLSSRIPALQGANLYGVKGGNHEDR